MLMAFTEGSWDLLPNWIPFQQMALVSFRKGCNSEIKLGKLK
jgi:hypothetical protein